MNKPTLVFSSGIINYWKTLDSSIGKKDLKIERWRAVNKKGRNCSVSAQRADEGRKQAARLSASSATERPGRGRAPEDCWATALKDFEH